MSLTFLESSRLQFSDYYISVLLISVLFFPPSCSQIFTLCNQDKANSSSAQSRTASLYDVPNWLSV